MLIAAPTLGALWLETSRRILSEGEGAAYDGLRTLELRDATLVARSPDSEDATIAEHADPEWLAWMRANFREPEPVEQLGGAASYATRLYDYEGRDQVAWVVERLRADPESRSATITTFQPLTDTSYIPCVSLLDFWRPDGALELVVYAHSLDFGKKAYGNLVELARLQEHVAGELGWPVGRLTIHVKSAHVYEQEWESMRGLTGTVAAWS